MVGAALLAGGLFGATVAALRRPSREDARARAIAAAQKIEAATGLHGFACWIAAAGFRESRWNTRAGAWERDAIVGDIPLGQIYSNTARGLFGMRPEGANGGDLDGAHLLLLGPPEVQVVFAADLVHRLITKYGAETWADVNGGWALPRLARPANRGEQRRLEADARYRAALEHNGTPQGCGSVPTDYTWPGGRALLRVVL